MEQLAINIFLATLFIIGIYCVLHICVMAILISRVKDSDEMRAKKWMHLIEFFRW